MCSFADYPFTDRWLTTYTEANPSRSSYVFCIAPKYPGYFQLCFKQSPTVPVQAWFVKVIPGAYELNEAQYSNMQLLCNGFKTIMANKAREKQMIRR